MTGLTRMRAAAPLLVAAVLAGVAVITVQRASCDDPGRYVQAGENYVLVGGCIAPGDIVVPGDIDKRAPTAPAPEAAGAEAPAKG